MDEHGEVRLPAPRGMTLQEALLMGYFSIWLLCIYGGLQTALGIFFDGASPQVKIMLEPFLLCLGFMLHIHWRKVTQTFQEHEEPRPRWVAACDAVSFMITFWAVWCLIEAFLQKANLI